MNISKVIKQFDEEFAKVIVGPFNYDHDLGEIDFYKEIKSFLTQALIEQREEIIKQLNMTILFNEKSENEGNIVDWSQSFRAFLKQLSKEEK